MNALTHITTRVAKAVLAFALVLVLTFVALTRTQVGRDGLRQEIERQFSSQFQGRIQIDQLKGNLVNDLFASDVRIFDPSGAVVLAADSVVMHPRWRDLFRRTVSIGSITLYRPEIQLVRVQDGSWNIARAFRSRISPRQPAASPWALNSTDVHIVDGTVATSNRGPTPELVASGKIFDFTNARLQNIDAAATVEWRPDSKVIELQRFSGDWPDLDIPLNLVQGQFVLEQDQISVSQVELRVGETSLGLAGMIGPLRALKADAFEDVAVRLRVQPSRIISADVRRFLPFFPLGDIVEIEGLVNGHLSDFDIENLRVERGQSRLLVDGTITGLPERITFDAQLQPSTITGQDVRAVLLGIKLPDLQHLGLLRAELSAGGELDLTRGDAATLRRLTSTFAVRSATSSANGTLDVKRSGNATLTYTANARVRGVDVGKAMQRASLGGQLNGSVAINGTGTWADGMRARVNVNLGRSVFAGRAIDTLSVEANVLNKTVAATGYYTRGGSVLLTNGSIDLSGTVPAYEFDVDGRQVNLGALLLSDSLTTELNGHAVISGRGLSLENLGGRLEVELDSSVVRYGTTTHIVPPNRNTLEIVHPSSGESYLQLTGDVASVRFDGDIALDPLLALTRLWGTEAFRTLKREFDKPLQYAQENPNADHAVLNLPVEAAAVANEEDALRKAARASLTRAGLEQGLSTTMNVELHRPDLLSVLLPMLPPFEADLRSTMRFTGDADTLAVSGTISADSIQFGSIRTGPLRSSIDATANLNVPLDQSLVMIVDAATDSLRIAGFTTAYPSLSLHFRQRAGEISFSTRGSHNTGPLQLAAALELLPDRNRLTLFNLRLSAGNYEWTSTDDYPIDLFSDAVVIPSLTLQSWTSDSGPAQRIHIHGTLSHSVEDKLSADVRNISLRQLSDALKFKRPVSGLVHGEIALTGGFSRPVLTGQIDVPVLVYANRVLGELNVTSQYIPGSPDVALDVLLQPVTSLQSALGRQAEELQGGRGLIPKKNAIHLGGTFRLPRVENGAFTSDAGALNLKLDASRVDLFFFENIFPDVLADVEGYATASGMITGTFRKPVPDIQAEIKATKFNIPEFKLAYTAEGPVSIDTKGIHLNGAQVTDGSGGTAVLNGGILFNDYRYFSFNVQGKLDELQIINVMQSRDLPFYGRIWASGTAHLTGPVYNAMLRSPDAVTSERSEVFIPLVESDVSVDPGFIVFADSTGKVPDLRQLVRRRNLLSRRPTGERTFLDGLEMDLNIFAQPGSTVHLVIDPLLGDVINAVGSGRIQLQLMEGEFSTFGTLDVTSGDYLFTAGDVFMRRFLIDEGTITWDGDPIDALMNIQASYRTRASTQGLEDSPQTVPLIVRLGISGRVSTPEIGLRLALDRRDRNLVGNVSGLETLLNQPDKATEFATSVLLTNSFLLTTDQGNGSDITARSGTSQFAFTSLSQLVTSQINRYVGQAIPNLDVNFGLQTNRVQDLDISYGVALRLLDERLVIRGQGVYLTDNTAERLRGEFVVEVRLSPKVSVEVFYRKEGDQISDATSTNTTGAGLSYQTQFSTWRRLTEKLFGWALPDSTENDTAEGDERNETGTGLPATAASFD